MKKANLRERIFITEYFVDFNAERAALTAGYSKSLAKSKAYQWVSLSPKNPKPHLREAIEAKMQERAEKTEITIDKIEEELSVMAFGKSKGELSPSDKLKALELLGKRRGAWKETVELTGGPLAATQIIVTLPNNQRDDNKIDPDQNSEQGRTRDQIANDTE